MNDPSLEHTVSPSPSPSQGSPRFHHVLDRMRRSAVRSGLMSLAVAGGLGLMLGNDVLPSVAPLRMAAYALAFFGAAQLVRWTAYHRMMEVHAHFTASRTSPVRSSSGHSSSGHSSNGHAQGSASMGSPSRGSSSTGRRRSWMLPAAASAARVEAAEEPWFGSHGDAEQYGWSFFEECGKFAGLPVPRFAEHEGLWHEYMGLAAPELEGSASAPVEGTVRFGRLLYKRLSSPPEGVAPASA